MLEPARSVEQVDAEVESLRADVAGLNGAELEQCRRLRDRLLSLRRLWRRNSSLFRPEVVDVLKAVSAALESQTKRAFGDPHSVLAEAFGYSSFRPGQLEIIQTVLSGRDCLGIMPTGAGKSITYQLPARMLGGTTLVISPLIALMKDQVDALSEAGVPATFINSSLTGDERMARLSRARSGEFELIYAAPEGLDGPVGKLLHALDLRLIAVDEAHCISAWGHDFRPAYRNLSDLKRRFASTPMLALTATATHAVTEDIIAQLGMKEPAVFRGSFFRDNLRISAYQKGDGLGLSATRAIVKLVVARGGESGIVYCLSRKSTESTAGALKAAGVAAAHYHAGLSNEERSAVQDAFRNDDLSVVVATIAFGMGIDKSNVRYVIHHDLPRSVDGYYQEIGRAGRDGTPSDCVLFYSWNDVRAYDRFAERSENPEQCERTRAQSREMLALAQSSACRHQSLARYFGEALEACGSSCDVCGGFDVLAKAKLGASRETTRRAAHVSSPTAAAAHADAELFERLRALRRTLARERGVPPYVVFSDATLLEMASLRPSSRAELSSVSGVGPAKLERYAEAFLRVLREA